MKLLPLLFSASLLFARDGPPSLTNAHLETRALSGTLEAALSARTPSWFGYTIPSLAGDHSCCCSSLEEERTDIRQDKSAGTGQLEPAQTLALLFRVTSQGVEKIRSSPLSCPLDAGGLPFVWLTGVSPAQSLSYLNGIATGSREAHLADAAVFAIAQHAATQADQILAEFARSNHPEHLRDQAIFWLGASRGASGLAILQQLVKQDPNEHIRDKAVFALSISKQPAALETLIETAHSDSSAHVRSQALFWLAQKAGVRAVSALTTAIANDPDMEVKKQAVFALSQLPRDEAVPRLIEIARSQKNPEVRKQAFFWLGQTNDPRALHFIEEVLTN